MTYCDSMCGQVELGMGQFKIIITKLHPLLSDQYAQAVGKGLMDPGKIAQPRKWCCMFGRLILDQRSAKPCPPQPGRSRSIGRDAT